MINVRGQAPRGHRGAGRRDNHGVNGRFRLDKPPLIAANPPVPGCWRTGAGKIECLLRISQDHSHAQLKRIEYALIGAVAVAFHSQARFTKDIDLLIREGELDRVTQALKREGYVKSSAPWTFKDSNLHAPPFSRRGSRRDDRLTFPGWWATSSFHQGEILIANALEAVSEGTGG